MRVGRGRPDYDLFVDTSAFYALGSGSDGYHSEAVAIMRRVAPRDRLFTSNFIVAEAHALLLRRQGRHVAMAFLRNFQAGSIAVERVTESDETEAIRIIERYADKAFSYADATSFAMMKRFGVAVAFSSDRNFVQYGYVRAQP